MTQSHNRRDFIKASAGAAALAGMASAGTLAVGAQGSKKRSKQLKVQVHHEWGALKEVV